ncbi:hypothetical protein Q9966_009973 [Columba livia]|nr:hypothetical protein Q9966_009973 [Columba livia]
MAAIVSQGWHFSCELSRHALCAHLEIMSKEEGSCDSADQLPSAISPHLAREDNRVLESSQGTLYQQQDPCQKFNGRKSGALKELYYNMFGYTAALQIGNDASYMAVKSSEKQFPSHSLVQIFSDCSQTHSRKNVCIFISDDGNFHFASQHSYHLFAEITTVGVVDGPSGHYLLSVFDSYLVLVDNRVLDYILL